VTLSRSLSHTTIAVSLVASGALAGCGGKSTASPSAVTSPRASASAPDRTAQPDGAHQAVTAVLTDSAARMPTDAGLHHAAAILGRRLSSAGVTPSHVQVDGHKLLVRLPGQDIPRLKTVIAAPGRLRFRQVLDALPTAGATIQATPSAPPRTRVPAHPRPGSESPSLTPALEATFRHWNCGNPATSDPTGNGKDAEHDYIVACGTGRDGAAVYLLAPSTVDGTGITTASGSLDPTGKQWMVNVTFNRAGADAWQRLTAQAYAANHGQSFQPGHCSPPKGCNAVAIVLDGTVQAAPSITSPGGIPGGLAQVTGDYTQHSATQLADIFKAGPLPFPLTVARVVRPV
jgi:preprotein translocase subunit SecD